MVERSATTEVNSFSNMTFISQSVTSSTTCQLLQGTQHGDIQKRGNSRKKAIHCFHEIKSASKEPGLHLWLCPKYCLTLVFIVNLNDSSTDLYILMSGELCHIACLLLVHNSFDISTYYLIMHSFITLKSNNGSTILFILFCNTITK